MKTCVLTESKSSFEFTCDSALLSKAITKIVTVADFSKGSEDKSVCILASYKGALFVIGYSTETFSAFQVSDVKTNTDGSFQFTPKTLLGLIKNRSELKFKYDKGRLHFSAVKGKYSGDIATSATPAEGIHVVNSKLKNEKHKSTTVTGALLNTLRDAMKACNLSNFYNSDPINCLIRAKDGKLDVSSFDNFHMSYYRATVPSESHFKMAIPINMFNLIDRFTATEGEDVEFVIGQKQFIAFGKTYIISLPPIQMDDNLYSQVPGYIKNLTKPAATLIFKEAGIKTVGNMFTISDENSKLMMKIGSGRVDISLSNENGTVQDAFKTEAKLDTKSGSLLALIDPRVFSDLFNKCSSSEVPMSFFQRTNKGKSSAFLVTNHTKTAKSYLVGTYSEE